MEHERDTKTTESGENENRNERDSTILLLKPEGILLSAVLMLLFLLFLCTVFSLGSISRFYRSYLCLCVFFVRISLSKKTFFLLKEKRRVQNNKVRIKSTQFNILLIFRNGDWILCWFWIGRFLFGFVASFTLRHYRKTYL